MEIEVAKNAGFCFGVKRAVDTVYDLIKNNRKIYTLGPIIHNNKVIHDLEEKGVCIIDNLSQINDKDAIVIIRAHGVGKNVYDEIKNLGIEYIDLTCPYVKKIHKIVEEKYNDGYQIVVIGKQDHPEVIGINGWCDNSAIILYDEDISEISRNINKICVVAQTTITKEKFYNYIKFLKKCCNYIDIFDTICSATSLRQNEAINIANNSDLMIVIGDNHSSNSKELFNKCKLNCENTILIQSANDLKEMHIVGNKVGITAGASTPAYIIKEVLNIMSEEKNIPVDEENFAEILENYLNSSIHTGKMVKGTVEKITATEVSVNVPGYKGVGVISADNLTDDPQLTPHDLVKIGDEVEAIVIKTNDVEGIVQLSKKRVDAIKNSEKIKEAFESQEIIKGKVIDINKGGLSVLVDGFRVFVPNSQAAERFTEDLNYLMNTEVSLRIIDFNEQRKRAVGSIRTVLLEEKKKKQNEFWTSVEVGKKYNGQVKSITNFGAFVDLGGVDGLIHISELSWGRIKHPSEVLKEGDIVEVEVKEIDSAKNNVSLSYKKSDDNPWTKAENELKAGDVIDCKIVRLVPFGAFAEIYPFVDGLIHISQIANKRIAKPADVLKIGETVKAKIIDIDLQNKKISLSIKALIEEEGKDVEIAETVDSQTLPIEEADTGE